MHIKEEINPIKWRVEPKVSPKMGKKLVSSFCPSAGSLRVDQGANRQHQRDWDGEYTWLVIIFIVNNINLVLDMISLTSSASV